MSKLQWGIIGTGHIAEEFVDGVNESTTGQVVAVGSRSQVTADQFGGKYKIPRRYSSYEALLTDREVEAVYISTPHPMHAEWAIKAAEAGKHILVEKPIGMNVFEAMAVIDAARLNDVFLMEAFMYRCHPQIAKILELVASGTLGKVQLIRATFSYAAPYNPGHRAYSDALGGGGILDVGCYPVSAARLIAGTAAGEPFAEPTEIRGTGVKGPTGVDLYAIASLKFPGDILAQVSTGVGINQLADNLIEIYASDAKLTVTDPWVPSRWNRNPVKLILKRHREAQPQIMLVEASQDLYAYEADMVANHIAKRQAPAMTWNDTIGNMRVLDRWRADAGVVYEQERPQNLTHTIRRRPLEKRHDVTMTYGRVAGLDKPVSRLVLGCDSNHTMPDTAILLDDYFERGGNTFDTSHAYGIPNGACEINLGWWVKNRGVRDKVVIIEKGANFPHNNPNGLTLELERGLERLQMDRVDLYFIHRDNEEIPIGEWVDVLNENLRAGRMTRFGLSNFSLQRLKTFQEYAAKKGLESFTAVSNQLSVARVLAPIWTDCHLVSAWQGEFREWFAKTQTPLFSWSSQARGFFSDLAAPEKLGNSELVRCWYSDDNFERKRRAKELAAKKGVHEINIALAWVLHQPFPTFPLVGPKRPWEVKTTLDTLAISLSPDEVDWLNIET
jgi:predicted dehydrogenase/aryl-alcohol dehydrogenase-like predicted oxidoreductase